MATISKKEDKCIRLQKLIDLGTKALRHKFDILLPPYKLQKILETFKPNLTHRISRQEYDRLFPQGGAPVTSDDMDLTTLVRVLRNTVLDEPLTGFVCLPQDSDTSFAADVVRIIFTRNKLCHTDFGSLKDHECQNMSSTLIEVIQRFSDSRFDNDITRIMTSSLDYRAGSLIWHSKMVIALVPNAFNEFVLQPAKASVIRLNEQQPLTYSIVGGTVISGIMQDISEIQSCEELCYYLFRVRNLTIRQFFLILYECSFLKQKLAELNFCQRKQDDSLNDTTPVDLRTEVNVTIPGSNSDLPLLLSQSGHVKNTFMLLPRSCAIGQTYTNDKLFDEQYFSQLPCLEMVYNKLFEQKSSTSYSRLLKGSESADSTTEIKRSFEENVEKNLDATCWIVQSFKFPASSQSSTNYPGSNWLPPHGCVSMKHAEMGRVPSDNSVTNLSESYLKERLGSFIWEKDYELFNKKARDEPNLFCGLRWYFMLTIFLFVFYIIVREVYPYSYAIFKSRIQAASLTALVVLFYLMFILQIYIYYM